MKMKEVRPSMKNPPMHMVVEIGGPVEETPHGKKVRDQAKASKKAHHHAHNENALVEMEINVNVVRLRRPWPHQGRLRMSRKWMAS